MNLTMHQTDTNKTTGARTDTAQPLKRPGNTNTSAAKVRHGPQTLGFWCHPPWKEAGAPRRDGWSQGRGREHARWPRIPPYPLGPTKEVLRPSHGQKRPAASWKGLPWSSADRLNTRMGNDWWDRLPDFEFRKNAKPHNKKYTYLKNPAKITELAKNKMVLLKWRHWLIPPNQMFKLSITNKRTSLHLSPRCNSRRTWYWGCVYFCKMYFEPKYEEI